MVSFPFPARVGAALAHDLDRLVLRWRHQFDNEWAMSVACDGVCIQHLFITVA